MPQKTNDPQLTVTGHLKNGAQGELICFNIRLGYFELACIVNIPAEGETSAPVYVKWKIRWPERRDEKRAQETSAPEDEG